VTESVSVERDGDVAIIVIDHPPVNALSHAIRAGLLDAIEHVETDATVQAVVIHGQGRMFIAGADIREFDAPHRAPLLPDVLLRIESCAKPVVAALHGSALGGGFELALACHYRCASPDAQVGLPEVKLGLLPGAGGTQRLPRLVGVPAAIEMMTSGEPIGLDRMRELEIVDFLVTGDLRAGAVDYARHLAVAVHQTGAPPRRLRDARVDTNGIDAAFFARARKSLPRATRKLEAAERIIQCVEAATRLPFDAGQGRARELFEQCRNSTESKALRHLFFAERGGNKAAAQKVSAREVKKVAVLGAGTMGSGIAISLATSGYQVALIDTSVKGLEAGTERVRTTIDGLVQKGRIAAEEGARAVARVAAALDLGAASDADLVIEAVFESLSIKQEVFAKLDEVCKPGAVLATNTSTLDVDAIAAATSRPADVVGMHFFSPANIMRLVEIVRGGKSTTEAIATAQAVTRRLGKIGVVVGNCFGFVGNRMLYGYGRETQLLLLAGVPPERIDRVLEEFGMAMGPNAVGDLAGLDVGYRVRRERKDLPDDPRYYRVADLLVEAGRLGQKTGFGTYRYEPGSREPKPDPAVSEIIRAEARRLGVEPREVSDSEILERCLFALANEGARILEEGIAASAGDIDVIWANGYGFPRSRGGPMFYADTVGLDNVLAAIERFATGADARYWTPAPLLIELARRGERFTTWSRELQ
jgi:3-hydroxyacyl-CoA dehydrogenase